MRFLLAVFSLSLALLTGCANLSEPQSTGDLSPIAKGTVKRDSVAKLDLPNDLWERIRKGYQMPNLENELANDRTQWYASKPDYLQRMTERSNKYLYHIVEELEARKMPTELALLPFIESAFNPQAVSSARASGMWQFMPKTGKSFDLKQNAFRDDRRDVQASTRAALDYLERLHKMFGDWHLALAAYNWGEGNVGKAIARNKRAGLPTGYTDLNMPMETRMYVPKLQAMKNIVGNPPQYGVELPSIPNHPYFQSVPLPRDMDVSVAAKLADISEQDFKALNPSAHRPVLLAAGSPNILLPWDNAEVFQRNYEASSIGRMATWTAWVAPSTMKVADAAKRVGMSEADFRAVNNIPPRMVIKAGSALLIPRGANILGDVTAQVADNGHLDLSPEAVAKRKAAGKGSKNAKGKKTASAKSTGKNPASGKGDKKGDPKVAKK
ncbi:MAG: lytic transglycosylase [Burkholderiales bacterium 35-55-47]|uniref:transglycosylase SLT domain-containing protein n=1 Tax=Limnohabitans sp. TaxID=1907725 RepID=UPI000BD20944|nr:transglycosylase SLT domain-containing protein [Limnohabitans sp.]OYY17974.1 MAG: lytic transglycosylase [Burkholderiales bacterium 35-55-47]OYZ73488.1 MAG: lytic transglycosylase [Burkholderiales bacterium 24-55-52]OZB00634.1 MAG: lytic transglycosylase [Burkholderiales bacterium 39-55-53]HQR85621.1 transglycosylase SLT domain-containing protein [Limnohabitans sp.]HQS26462.1 transglycosylase SLT domain-containing protein [Limnohabitans sp.]